MLNYILTVFSLGNLGALSIGVMVGCAVSVGRNGGPTSKETNSYLSFRPSDSSQRGFPGLRKESGISDEQVMAGVEKALRKYFGKRGERVVQDNMTCVTRGYKEVTEVPQEMIQG